MAGLVTVWLAARIVAEQRSFRSLWPMAAAWAVGLGLSAPAWLMLLDYMPETVRGQTDPLFRDNTWMVPWTSLPALIFPGFVGHWNVFGAHKFHQAAELCGGLVPIVILAVCLKGRLRTFVYELRWEWGLLAAALLLATLPSLGNFRWSFRWLPLFFLALAVVAAQTLALWRAQVGALAGAEGRMPQLGIVAFLLLFAVWLRAVIVNDDPTPVTMNLGIALLALCFLWSELEKRLGPTCRVWLPSGAVLCTAFLTYASNEHFCEVPCWQLDERVRQTGPLDPEVRYLSVYLDPDILAWQPLSLTHFSTGVGSGLYLGSTSLYSGVQFINGYSPFGPRGLDEIFSFRYHGFMQPEAAARILTAETGPHGLLALLGVDGLIVADRFESYRPLLSEHGWHEVAKVDGGTVYHRAGPASARIRAIETAEVVHTRAEAVLRMRDRQANTPVPLLLLDEKQTGAPGTRRFAPAQVTLVEDGRHRAVAEVRSSPGDGDVLVVFTRPWFPGYEAFCNGRPLPVELFDLILPAVRVPAGTESHVVLEYRPRAFIAGTWAAGATALVVAVALLVFAGQRALHRIRLRTRHLSKNPLLEPAAS